MKQVGNSLLPPGTWTAEQTLSFGMYQDESVLGRHRWTADGAIPVPCHRSHVEVRRELRDAIATGSVTARGFRPSGDAPPLGRETLPSEIFQKLRHLEVNVFGEVAFKPPARPQNVPPWSDIVFYEKEIRALFPKSQPIFDQWMLDDAKVHPKKREYRIQDCMKANSCTYKDAKAAYENLPDNLKGRRGRRLKDTSASK